VKIQKEETHINDNSGRFPELNASYFNVPNTGVASLERLSAKKQQNQQEPAPFANVPRRGDPAFDLVKIPKRQHHCSAAVPPVNKVL